MQRHKICFGHIFICLIFVARYFRWKVLEIGFQEGLGVGSRHSQRNMTSLRFILWFIYARFEKFCFQETFIIQSSIKSYFFCNNHSWSWLQYTRKHQARNLILFFYLALKGVTTLPGNYHNPLTGSFRGGYLKPLQGGPVTRSKWVCSPL